MGSHSDVDEGVSDIPEELHSARFELSYLYTLNDNLRQENYEQKLALDEQMFMVKTLSSEFALLQGDCNELKRKEEQHDEVVSELNMKLKELESCEKKDQTRLEEQNKELVEVASKVREDIGSLADESECLLEELKNLKEHCLNYTVDMKTLEGKNRHLEELVSENILEIAGLKESLACAKEECVSLEEQLQAARIDKRYTMETLKETKDELFCLQEAQSGSHVTFSPMSARGNSTFAEVEDDRLKMLSQYKEIKAKYSEMAKNYAGKSKEMYKCSSEKIGVLRLEEEMKRDEEKDKTDLIQALEKRISDLERANRDLTSELQVPVKVVTEMNLDTLKYVETIAEDSRQEVWKLKREFDDSSVALLKHQRQLNSCHSDLRRFKAENLKLKSELSEATLELQSFKENIPQDLPADEKTDPAAPNVASSKPNVLREVMGSNKQTCSPSLSKEETKSSNKTDLGSTPKLVSSRLEYNSGLPK